MQAIQVKYLPTTNTKGSRLKAFCDRGSITIPFPYTNDDGAEAVKALVNKFIAQDRKEYGDDCQSWVGWYIKGTLKNGDDVFVILPHKVESHYTYFFGG